MGFLPTLRWEYGTKPKSHIIIKIITLALISIVSLVVIGLYARDIDVDRRHGRDVDGRWAFGVALGVISVFSCLVHLFFGSRQLFPLDLINFMLWLVLFAIFGKLYISRDCKGSSGCERMKVAVWFDLVGTVLWLASFLTGVYKWRKGVVSGRGLRPEV